jgi:sigma-B regulation protein RsbU (phosphoserine phosphatase)
MDGIPRKLELLANVVEQTADSVTVTNRRGLVEYVNPAFETTTGFSRSEIVGRNLALLKSGRHDEAFYRDLWATILDGRVYRATITNRKKNGELFVSRQTITPIKDPSGAITHFVSVAKDITELERATRREVQLKLARKIQQKYYPDAPPRTEDLDIAGSASLADVTGGDYFDYIPLKDGTIGIAVGDASGHGVDSALLMAVTRTYLRSLGHSASDPGEILTKLNRLVAMDIPEESFVTLILVAVGTGALPLRYSSAGHPAAYVLDASGAIRSRLESVGCPLGILEESKYETVEAAPLLPGDLLMLLTDGIFDAGGPGDSRFGVERALEAILERLHLPSAQIVDGLFDAVRAFGEGRPPEDDFTAVACKKRAVDTG